MIDPVARITELDNRSTILRTPCAGGSVIWRRWGSGPPLVLLHGAYGSWRHWFRTIEPLAAGHTVIVPDLPGLGDSALPPSPVSLRSMAGILQDGLASIVPSPLRYDLAGFSFGVSVGSALAMLEGDRVRSFTAIGAGRLLPSLTRPAMHAWRHLASTSDRDAVHRTNLASLMIANVHAIDDLAVTIQRQNTELARLSGAEVTREPAPVHALRESTARIGVIVGERDPTVSLDRGNRQRLAETLPRLEIHAVPGAGHWVQYEAHDEVNRQLLRWIGGARHG